MTGQVLVLVANQIPLGISAEYLHSRKILHGNTHYQTQLEAKGFANDFQPLTLSFLYPFFLPCEWERLHT